MKFITLTKNFQIAVNSIKNIINKNTNLPILNSILIETEKNQIKLSSTNLELGINYFMAAKIINQGKIAVPAKTLSNFVSSIKNEKIEINSKDNILDVVTENFKTKIIGLNPEEFPLIPKIKDNIITSIPGSILKNALISVLDSISLLETRPEINGVFINFTDSKIYFVSTDSFRLSERIIDNKNNYPISLIVPKNTILELIRLLLNENEKDIVIYCQENQIQFSSENFDIISRLINGRYPDYQKVIPSKPESYLFCDRVEFQDTIKAASVFSSNINDVRLRASNNEIEISSNHPEKGEFIAKIKCQIFNNRFEVSLNYNYLLDGLKNINSQRVVIEYSGEGAPIILKPDNQDFKFTYLIMPLRV